MATTRPLTDDEMFALAVDPRRVAELAAHLGDARVQQVREWQQAAEQAGLALEDRPGFRSGLYAAAWLLRPQLSSS